VARGEGWGTRGPSAAPCTIRCEAALKASSPLAPANRDARRRLAAERVSRRELSDG
jgi:hypothetical protein